MDLCRLEIIGHIKNHFQYLYINILPYIDDKKLIKELIKELILNYN